MNRSNPLIILLTLLVGLGLGLTYSWVISPARYTDTTPENLRSDFKDQYRITIAAAFGSDGDVERARARLSLLGDRDSFQALSAQAQQMLAAGRPYEDVEQIVQLASALQGQITVASSATVSVSLPPQHTEVSTQTPAISPGDSSGPSQTTPQIIFTPTRRPTQTPIPTIGAPVILLSREEICDPELTEGLIQVNVIDQRRRPLPGMKFIMTWDGGQEDFYTGFKPDLGNGYADFQMTSGISYALKPNNGDPIPNITAPSCPTTNGSFPGGIKFSFQEP